MDTCVAIPVGGRVNLDYLRQSLEAVRQSGAVLYVGIDSQESLVSLHNYDAMRDICYGLADKVLEFPPEFYYRPGGIWKKIYDCWKASGCRYVRCLGYDDLLPPELIAGQDALMRRQPELTGSYSNLVIRDEGKGTDTFELTRQSRVNLVRSIGGCPFNFICWLVRFDWLATEEYERMLLKASAKWEWFFYATVAAGRVAHYDSPPQHSAIRREHIDTISSQATLSLDERNTLVQKTRDIAGYSAEQNWADWESLNIGRYYARKRVESSPLLAAIVDSPLLNVSLGKAVSLLDQTAWRLSRKSS